MNKQKVIVFLLSIAKEIEQSFQCPVIFFTEKDYADYIVKSLVELRNALKNDAKPTVLVEIVNKFHFEWLQAVQDIETFKKRLKDMPREAILKSIAYTINCLEKRYKYLCNHMKELQLSMTNEENQLMDANLDLIEEIKQIHHCALLDKQKNIQLQADQKEYLSYIEYEIEELLNWLDKVNDNLAIHFSKVLDLKVPILPCDLTKTLKQVIEEISDDPNPEAQRIAGLIHLKSKTLSRSVRISSVHELEIAKIVEKIKALEDRLSRLQAENSSAVMALQHKTIYLEDRLESLQNIKLSLIRLKYENNYSCVNERIFNHILPHPERRLLVERLIKLWNFAITEHDHESVISILSVADLKEMFSDVQGYFCVDKHGRKIYTKENDPNLYQLNENNEPVLVQDDEKHVYFYDECGRYYLNAMKRRVYKAHPCASEYLLSKAGVLFKVKEEKYGKEYYYDWLGRYYIGEDGKNIYVDQDGASEYEDDGLGNLIKVGCQKYYYDTYTKQTLSLEENKYLQKVVGSALKECIAKVILVQPFDPILYLAKSLIKYRQNKEDRQRRLDEEREILEERVLFDTTKENSPIPYVLDYKMDYETQTDQSY